MNGYSHDQGIPTESYDFVVDQSNRRRGTLPTHAVKQTVDDLAKSRDTVLEFTRELIRSGKGRWEEKAPPFELPNMCSQA